MLTYFLHPPPTTNVLICFSQCHRVHVCSLWEMREGGGGVNSQDPSVEIQSIIFLCSVQTVHIIQGTFSRQYRQHLWLSSVLQTQFKVCFCCFPCNSCCSALCNWTYHMTRRVASVVTGTADDESLPNRTRFKIRNTPNSNLKFDDHML